MTQPSHSPLLDISQAIALMLEHATLTLDNDSIPLSQALHRITASDIISPIDVPAFDNSAMDGYAVKLADLTNNHVLPVSNKIFAGHTGTLPAWPAGTCIRIMTGAPIPDGTDAVVMQENTEQMEHGIHLTQTVKLHENIRRRGEDIQKDCCVIPEGEKLSIPHLSLLASLGIAQVCVKKPLKVAIFSTGDELCPIGSPLQAGQIYDSNRFTLSLMLKELHCEVIDLGIIRDDIDALKHAFSYADQHADVVISSGGVSVGEADFTKDILDELGDIHFWKIAMKPGKPFAFGRLKRALFCGLPGNPVSAVTTFYQLVQPFLQQLMGYSSLKMPMRFNLPTESPLKKKAGRLDFQRGVIYSNERNELCVTTTGAQGSHLSHSLCEANCFIVLERERGHVNIGEMVTVEPFNFLLNNE